MNVTDKILHRIVSNLESIYHDTFDESDVKELLVNLRDCQRNSYDFLREICHFVAHPAKRDRGICQVEVDIKYLQLKYADLKENRELFPIDNHSSKEHKLLLKIIDIALSENMAAIGLSKPQARALLKGYYSHDNGRYIFKMGMSDVEVRKLVKGVIGRVYVKSVFTQVDVIGELSALVEAVLKHGKIDPLKYLASIEAYQNQIMLCIACHLQGANFKLYDNTIAQSRLSISNLNHGTKPETLSFNGVFSVPWTKNAFSVPVISTDILVEDFFSGDTMNENYGFLLFEVVRNNAGKLIVQQSTI